MRCNSKINCSKQFFRHVIILAGIVSEDFSLLVAFLLVTFLWLFRGPHLSRKTVFGPFSLLFRGFFVAFSWLFRGPRFGQSLRVLALEQSSDSNSEKKLSVGNY